MKELFLRLKRQLLCPHRGPKFVQIHRDWATYARVIESTCEDCGRVWRSRQVPESLRQQ